jgi:TetR/AcrR family transcriptional regulator, transcriptional repressor for nem operon
MAAGRPKEFLDEQALDKAIEVFCVKGYEAASTADLLEAMGMGKGSMYHAFGSKKELFHLAINRYVDEYLIQFEKDLNASKKPIELIKDYFRIVAEGKADEHRKGCFLGSTVVGLAGIDPVMAKHASGKLKAIEELFFIYIRRAQMAGQLKTKEDPKILARQLITFWNGLNVTRRMYPDNRLLSEIIERELAFLK